MILQTLRYLAVRVAAGERGATAVEYGLMVSLIAIVIIVAVTTLGVNLNESFSEVACRIGGGTWTAGTATTAGACAP